MSSPFNRPLNATTKRTAPPPAAKVNINTSLTALQAKAIATLTDPRSHITLLITASYFVLRRLSILFYRDIMPLQQHADEDDDAFEERLTRKCSDFCAALFLVAVAVTAGSSWVVCGWEDWRGVRDCAGVVVLGLVGMLGVARVGWSG
ncbi:hypothetical protein Tdes44962_MAKER01590 [Teratosphaeria destructans]|uniref:Uncharacterized protein n=1 Tax=Teratosphaeria destructans TaxID=418781 RepID=A0A9W7W617_9PEZI|nr:hypothetical protein Tdes44962_MAKER01590 [Teratosphaeria destructans]